MRMGHLLFGAILGSFVLATVPVGPHHAEAAQTTTKQKKKKPSQKKQQQQPEKYPHGLKKYPWGEPNAGWSDRCVFFYNTYDGWIPPFCRPYGRTF